MKLQEAIELMHDVLEGWGDKANASTSKLYSEALRTLLKNAEAWQWCVENADSDNELVVAAEGGITSVSRWVSDGASWAVRTNHGPDLVSAVEAAKKAGK